MKRKNPRKRDLDANMVALVKALHSFDGVQTIGSCGGHENPSGCEWKAGTFFLKFDVEWTLDGKFALEFLAWFFNDYMAWHFSQPDVPGSVRLIPTSPAPDLNTAGKCLSFVIEGFGNADPVEIAGRLNKARKEGFVTPEVAAFLNEWLCSKAGEQMANTSS